MSCLKCGRETQESQVFCPACQKIMRNHPVKPGTVIHLPHRDPADYSKEPPVEHWEERPDDQLLKLRKLTRWLTATIAQVTITATANSQTHAM